MNKKPDPVLRDHVRKGRKLIPPFLNALGERFSPYSWVRQITPEFIWIALLIRSHGFSSAMEIANSLGNASANAYSRNPKPLFAKFSSFSELDENEKKLVSENFPEESVAKLRAAFLPLNALAAPHPLSFICDDTSDDYPSDSEFIEVLNTMSDRESRDAVLSVAIGIHMGMTQGKILHAQHLHDKRMRDFADIVDFPNTEASRAAAGAFRASAPMFLFRHPNDQDESWVSFFWERVAGLGSCASPASELQADLRRETPVSDDLLEQIIVNYRNSAKDDLQLDRWQLDLNELEKFEVVGALLARQTTLAIDLAAAPPIWTPHVAPIILRSMADVFITLAWILDDLNARAKKFVEDGLGAVKLENAHRKKEIELQSDPQQAEQLQQLHDYWDAWMKSQRMNQFIEVNLGSWSGLTTRKMAEEAGFLDFYNFVYQPFSAAVHSNWAHLSDKNTLICENPAHRRHRIPTIIESGISPYWPVLAAKYLQKTFSHFDRKNGIDPPPSSAYDDLWDALYTESED